MIDFEIYTAPSLAELEEITNQKLGEKELQYWKLKTMGDVVKLDNIFCLTVTYHRNGTKSNYHKEDTHCEIDPYQIDRESIISLIDEKGDEGLEKALDEFGIDEDGENMSLDEFIEAYELNKHFREIVLRGIKKSNLSSYAKEMEMTIPKLIQEYGITLTHFQDIYGIKTKRRLADKLEITYNQLTEIFPEKKKDPPMHTSGVRI